MYNNLKIIQDLVKCLANINVHLIRGTDEEITALINENLHNIVQQLAEENFFVNTFHAMRDGCVYEIRDFLSVCFLVICDSTSNLYLVVGPCVTERLSKADAKAQMRKRGLDQERIEYVLSFCEQLPDILPETLHQLGLLLVQHLQGAAQPISYHRVEYQWDVGSRNGVVLVDRFEELSRMRQIELRYEHSAALTEAVKEGNLSLAYQFMRQMNPEVNSIVRNPNPLRNTQNMCIILNTQLRHAMEDSGIHPYRLDRFSNDIAIQIEQLKTQNEASRFAAEIIRRYCDLAQEYRYSHLKPFTRLTVAYIKTHLSDNLTVKDTAKALTVNANYLSYQFHQDVGMTFIDFVNQERTNQAAALLKHTDMQIQQIATTVGYNNTSYFAKQFLRFHGMTPRSYRNSGLL